MEECKLEKLLADRDNEAAVLSDLKIETRDNAHLFLCSNKQLMLAGPLTLQVVDLILQPNSGLLRCGMHCRVGQLLQPA